MSVPVGQLVERLWPGRWASFEPLSGGITNANYVVDLGEERVVLRIPGENSDLLGIDRRREADANRMAALLGVAPEVLTLVDEGLLVTRFLPGRAIPPVEMAREPMLAEVVATLRSIHAAGTIDATFNPFLIVRRYHETARAKGVREPFDFPAALVVLDRILAARPFRASSFCHNDLLNGNFLYDDRVRVLDWEYAGMGDPFFDLANFSVNHGLEPEADERLLLHYFGHCDVGLVAVLELMKLVSELREAMWGVVQLAVSTLDVDFAGYAEERGAHFAQLLGAMDLPALIDRAGQLEAP